MSIVVGAVVLLLWIPLRQRPGLGTISNVSLIGAGDEPGAAVLPHAHALAWRIAELVGGIVLCGVATGMYIGADFGPGPRDGLMTGLARRTGRSIRLTRTGIELTVLAAGWLLGGTVGRRHGAVRRRASARSRSCFAARSFDTGAPQSAGVEPARRRRAGCRSVVLVVGAGQPGGEPVDRRSRTPG